MIPGIPGTKTMYVSRCDGVEKVARGSRFANGMILLRPRIGSLTGVEHSDRSTRAVQLRAVQQKA